MSLSLVEALAASTGGLVATFTLYPIELVKNQIQSSCDDDQNNKAEGSTEHGEGFVGKFMAIYRDRGLAGLYTGCQASAMHSVLEKFGYFYAYATLRELAGGTSITAPINLAVGYMSEWAHLLVTLPVELIMARLQTGEQGGFFGSFRTILNEGGIGCFYNGWRTYIVLAMKPAIENAVFEQLKIKFLRMRHHVPTNAGPTTRTAMYALSAIEAFCLGAVARAVSTLICFPATRAKMILQSTKMETTNESPPSVICALGKLIRKGGILGLYAGIGPELLRGVLSSAIKMSVKERIALFYRTAMLGGAVPLVQ